MTACCGPPAASTDADDDACLRWLAEREAAMPEPVRGVPFAVVWWPGVVARAAALATQEAAADRPLQTSALVDLQVALLSRLCEVSAPTLLAAFDAGLPAGQRLLAQLEPGPPARTRFARFCRELAEGGLLDLLLQYPVLPSLLGTLARQWHEASVDLLRRVARDRDDLARVLGVPVDGALTQVLLGAGDRHDDGRCVAVIAFGEARVVYKPRDVRLERLWAELVDLIRPQLGDPAPCAAAVLACDDGSPYGFMEFVPNRPAPTSVALRRFYRNAGATLALLHALSASDCHHENLVACDDQLVLVDAEALFETRRTAAVSGGPDGPGPLGTVLQTGVLPAWTWMEGTRTAIDVTALGTTGDAGPHRSRHGWRAVNTDAMSRGPVTITPPHPTSLPTPPGVTPHLADHLDDVLDGFAAAYRAIVAARGAGLLDLERRAAGLARRVVLRATYVYAILLDHSREPKALSDAVSRSHVLEQLARAFLGADHDSVRPLLVAEQEALARLDIPRFEASLAGHRTTWFRGYLDGWPGSDALADVCARIDAMDESDLAWQARLIRSTFATHAFSPVAARVDEHPITPATAGRAAELAGRIRARIVRDALLHEDRATWMTLALLPDGGKATVQRVGAGLYEGALGIAAFLHSEGEDELARAALGPVLDALDPDQPMRARSHVVTLGLGWAGAGGHLRALPLLSTRGHLASQEADRGIRGVVHSVSVDQVARDRWLDVINGCAGLIAPLARLVATREHSAAEEQRMLEIIAVSADHLLDREHPGGGWMTLPAAGPLTGMAHGASGIALALVEAFCVLPDSRYLDAAIRALDYETSLFDADAGNWPDLRDSARGRFMLGWCAGAPGIALARLRLLELLPGHPRAGRWRQELELGVAACERAPLLDRDHLCCGNLGRVAILRHLGQRCARADWVDAADRLRLQVAGRADDGLPRSFMGDTNAAVLTVPGLMTGQAGCGLVLRDDDTAWVSDLLG